MDGYSPKRLLRLLKHLREGEELEQSAAQQEQKGSATGQSSAQKQPDHGMAGAFTLTGDSLACPAFTLPRDYIAGIFLVEKKSGSQNRFSHYDLLLVDGEKELYRYNLGASPRDYYQLCRLLPEVAHGDEAMSLDAFLELEPAQMRRRAGNYRNTKRLEKR